MLYNIIRVIARFVLLFVFRIRIKGRENIPKEGGVIFAFNHRSYWDPVIAGVTCPRRLSFMAKEELFKNPIFGGLIKGLGAFPISRGRGDIGAIKGAFKILRANNAMLIFPEGRRIKDGGKAKAKPGVAMIASRANVPVIPVCIYGAYRWMSKITVSYGEPIYIGMKRSAPDEMQNDAQKILDNIYALKPGVSEK